MPTLSVGTLDRLLANVLLAGARRRWPLLSLVPARWLRPLLMPTAARMRNLVARSLLLVALPATASIVLFVGLH